MRRNAKRQKFCPSPWSQINPAMEAVMRAHHVITVVAVLVIGLGAKQFMFPPRQADASINVVPSASMNVLQMHSDIDMKNLPQQKMNDKAFIFTDEE